jgi:hypothetical protein
MPPPTANEDSNVARAHELANLMENLTSVEEAVVRQITPMLSIVRLAQRNFATRGNMSCVFQKSTLSRILPNLPQNCKYIVIQQRNNRNNSDGR